MTCQVKCRRLIGLETPKFEIAKCGKPCNSLNHFHHDTAIKEGENTDEIHSCGNPHLCPKECEEKGICEIVMNRFYKAKPQVFSRIYCCLLNLVGAVFAEISWTT